MRLLTASEFPRPHKLHEVELEHPIRLDRDVTAVSVDDLPRPVSNEPFFIVDTSFAMEHPKHSGAPHINWYASIDDRVPAYAMNRGGFTTALAAAQLLAKCTASPLAVMQYEDGTRYIVPLSIWNDYDELERTFDDIGGEPHWEGKRDHVLVAAAKAGVEALVFDHGKHWVKTKP